MRSFLGAGGMGIVYRGDDRTTGEQVAIKVARAKFRRDPIVVRHFRREAMVGARVTHPSLVTVRDAGTFREDTPYIVMDLVDGRPLKSLLAVEGLWSLRRIGHVLHQLLDGLQTLHALGFVHADVKTDNILVRTRDDGDLATLIDFGLAHVPSEHDPNDTIVSGTPEYMAPEVITGRGAIPASDIYAAGVILYELLTGTTPFAGGTTAEILRRHLQDRVVAPSVRSPDGAISSALDDVALRALERDPRARFPDAAAFATALAGALAHAPATRRARPCFSTMARTVDTTAPMLGELADASATRRARVAVVHALREGDPDRIASATLELVGMLVAGHRLFEAATTLEEAVKRLGGDRGLEDCDAPRSVWRLLHVLAGLCDSIGQPQRARQLAREALRHATRARSETGTIRVRELLDRFNGRVRPSAR